VAHSQEVAKSTGFLERLADALVDPRRRERTVVTVLLGYMVLWTLYAVVAKGSQDLHFDMGELIAWSRQPALGYPNHPPFAAWIVAAWFNIFPQADWAYYLLATANATLALWIVWALSQHYLDSEKRLAGLALLTLIPFFNFHALKFNANSVLLSLWAATTWWFLRSFETHSIAMAVLAGLGAGAAMLGKYWSIALIAGLGLAVLVDPRRGAYFASPAPWITIAVGALVLAPHLAWLVAHDFAPIAYAAAKVAATGFPSVLASVLRYLTSSIGYVAVPALLWLIATRPSSAALLDGLWPSTSDRRLVAVAFWAPLLLPVAAALALGSLIHPLWAMPNMTLLSIVLLSSPLIVISRGAVVRLLAVAIALPIVATLAAPIVAVAIHLIGVPTHAGHYRLLGGAIERAWRASSDRPLRFVGSDGQISNGVISYLTHQTTTLNVVIPSWTPWADDARIAHDGVALVCSVKETICVEAIEALASRWAPARPTRTEVQLVRHYLGIAGAPERYLIIIVPPQP